MIEDHAAQFLKAPAESRYLVAPQRRRRSHWGRRGSRRPTTVVGDTSQET